MSLRRALFVAFSIIFYSSILIGMCLIAGRWDLPFFWIVTGALMAMGVVACCTLDEDLLMERMNPPKGQNKDPLGITIISILFFSQFILAALDVGRWHVSDSVPIFLQIIAVVFTLIGWLGLYWAIYTNRFFSSAIRMQPDRGQFVISSGPYTLVRHPGYAFGSIGLLAQGFAFGSYMCVIPMIGLVGYLAHRTNLEEKMLAQDLPGYREYSEKVRFRWIPGVW
ncbi:MAG TPA: isoprenylcysteine carboxylmethyltransferase family protein [Oculatellaceae cyanobacterium]